MIMIRQKLVVTAEVHVPYLIWTLYPNRLDVLVDGMNQYSVSMER